MATPDREAIRRAFFDEDAPETAAPAEAPEFLSPRELAIRAVDKGEIIDLGGGKRATQQTATFGTDRGFVNVPTIRRGRKLSEDEVRAQIGSGIFPVFDTEEKAVAAAQRRSNAIDSEIKVLEGPRSEGSPGRPSREALREAFQVRSEPIAAAPPRGGLVEIPGSPDAPPATPGTQRVEIPPTAGPTGVPFVQRQAERFFGIEPQPIPELPQSIVPEIRTPPGVRQAEQIGDDIVNRAMFLTGIDPIPQGNIPAKVEALRQATGREDLDELGVFELVGQFGSNALTDVGEITTGVGMMLALPIAAPIGAFTNKLRLAGLRAAGLGETRVFLPDGRGGESEVVFPVDIEKMPPEVVAELVALGARFGPEPNEQSLIDEALDAEAERLGFVNPDEIPEGATSFGVPFTDRRFVPSQFGRESFERPVSRLLDLTLVGSLPSAALRGTASGLARSGALVGRAGQARTGAVAGGLQRIERALAKGSVATREASERARLGRNVRRLTRGSVRMTPAGRRLLERHDARVMANRLVNRASEESFALRREAEVELSRAIQPLSDFEKKVLPAVVEGRAQIRPEALSPQMEHAQNVVRRQIRLRQDEMLEAGLLRAETVEDRRFAPLVVTQTGKLIPEKGWSPTRVGSENAKIRKANQRLGGEAAPQPEYMLPEEFDRTLAQVRRDIEDVRRSVDELPETADLEPVYFPRFPEPQNVREVLREFFPRLSGRPGRLPIQRRMTGAQLLRNADIKDVKQQLLRHNAQVRRLVDSERLIRQLEDAPFTKPLTLDRNGRPLDLLEGHVAYNPEGTLQFFRKQLDLGEQTARALDDMGELESALAQGVRAALGDELQVSFPSVTRRRKMFQVPASAADVINKSFAPTPKAVRLLIDKPLEAWKTAVLAFSPRWHLNNLVGGMLLGSVAGVPPQRLLRPISAAQREVLPSVLRSQTLTAVEGFRPNLGSAADTATARVAQAIANSKPMRLATGPAARVRDASFALNAAVDNHFRSRVYLELGRGEARNTLMKETGRAYFEGREILQKLGELGADQAGRTQLLEKLDNVFINFNNMSPFERRYMRRVLPFWSWYREINRVALTMPERSPIATQALRQLSLMGKEADEREVRRNLGIPKRYLPEYMRGEIFLGMDETGEFVTFSPRGLNVFYGVAQPQTLLGINPVIQAIAEEAFGGRHYGRWGNFVPFRLVGENKRIEVGPDGRLRERRGLLSGTLLRTARLFPQTKLFEDLAQQGTEGQITQRFENVSPLANLGPALRGETVKPTAVVRRNREGRFEARGQKTLAQPLLQQVGINLRRYRATELLEQEYKSRAAALNTIVEQMMLSDPEFRELMTEILGEMAGTRSEGLRTLDPEEATGR